MGKKKINQIASPQTSQSSLQKTTSVEPPLIQEPTDDPVSQLKLSLAALTKHVEAIGSVLGVPSRQKSSKPEATGQEKPNEFGHSNIREDKQAQRNVKAEEKKIRPDVTKANKQAETTVESKREERPEMTQEEKQAQRKAKVEAKKARAEAAIAKKQAQESENLQLSKDDFLRDDLTEKEKNSFEAKQKEPIVIQNGVASSPLEQSSVPNLRPINNQPPKKSSLKKKGQNENEHTDLKVKFGYSYELSGSTDSLNVPAYEEYPIPSHIYNHAIHPAFQMLLTRCEMEQIYEIDDLCIEFINVFNEYFIYFLKTSEKGELKIKEFLEELEKQINYLKRNGPLPLALENIEEQLKREIRKMKQDENEEYLEKWKDHIKKIKNDHFEYAYGEMANHLRQKLKKAKTLLLYNCNRVMEKVIMHCKDQEITLQVLDDKFNGRGFDFAKRFLDAGFKVQYSTVSGIAVLLKTTKIAVLGCSSILSNGNVASPKGAIQVCQMANLFNVPTVILAQCFKFVDKINVNSRMALLYREAPEIIPSDLVTAIVTEMRILPPSSALAVLSMVLKHKGL